METGDIMIFLDTSFLISLFANQQKNHWTAKKIYKKYEKIEPNKMINGVVLAETLNQSDKCQIEPCELYETLKRDTNIVCIDKNDYKYSLELNKYYDNSINFKDCLILKTMFDYQINKIMSFDRDFDKIDGITRIY